MITSKQQAREHMRPDLHAAIRRNLFCHRGSLSPHQLPEILASVLPAQLEIIQDDARKQRNQ